MLNHNTKPLFTQRAAPLMLGVGHARQAAGACSAKADRVRLAVASHLGSNVLVESATALRRDVARAGGQRLQVVRIARLAARVRGVMQLAFTHRSTTAPSPREQRNDASAGHGARARRVGRGDN